MVTCPECDSDIDVEEDELDEGDTFNCDECGATLKVLSLDPLEMESDADTGDEDEDEEDFMDEEDEDEDEEEEEEESEDEDW